MGGNSTSFILFLFTIFAYLSFILWSYEQEENAKKAEQRRQKRYADRVKYRAELEKKNSQLLQDIELFDEIETVAEKYRDDPEIITFIYRRTDIYCNNVTTQERAVRGKYIHDKYLVCFDLDRKAKRRFRTDKIEYFTGNSKLAFNKVPRV